jgi:hypothetical protein
MSYRTIASCCAALAACGDNRIVVPTLESITISAAEDTPLIIIVPLTAAHTTDVTMTVVTAPSHGTIIGQGPSYTYTPVAEYSGDDSIVVRAEDTYGSAMATVTIHVAAVDDPPVANSDLLTTDVGIPLIVPVATLLLNDTDIDSTTLMVTAVSAGAHGTVVFTGTDVAFTPETGYVGPATFSYTLSDGTRTTIGTVTIGIGDTRPVAVDDFAITAEDVALVIADGELLANDSDAEHQTLTIVGVNGATHGTLSHTASQVTFTPDANYNGPASFSYTVSDGFKTDVATVSVLVTLVNDPPVAVDDTQTTNEDTPLTILVADLTANDTDIDNDSLIVINVTSTASTHGTVTLSSGVITYSPDANFNGDASFTYTVSDGQATAVGAVAVTVTPVDDAPVAVNDTATAVEDSTANEINVLANDTDVDAGPISIASVTQAAHGTVAMINNGTSVTYTPAANYCNHIISPGLRFSITPNASLFDQFTYTLTPGGTTATVTVTVSCVDDPPVAANDAATAAEGSSNNLINVLANDTDIDGGSDTIASVTQPANGTAAVGPNGLSVAYTPDPGYCNQIPNGPPDTFSYTLSPGTSSATVAMTVICACGQLHSTDFVVGAAR